LAAKAEHNSELSPDYNHETIMKTKDLRGKVTLTTGASSGIGAAIAREAAARGAFSLLVGRNADRLAEVEHLIRSEGGRSKAYVSNLTDAREIELLRSHVMGQAGVPDILINNAGNGRWAYLEECSYDEIDEIIAAPLHAALYVTRAFLPGMLHRGSGAIGNVTFIGAFLPWPGATGCTAVRWGMRGFHEALKADLRGTNLSATLVAASAVETEYWRKNRTPKPVTPAWIPILKPDEVARASLNALLSRKSVLVLPMEMRLLRALDHFTPGLVDRIMQQSTGLTRK
jgi:short-subunit dehydrogenase